VGSADGVLREVDAAGKLEGREFRFLILLERRIKY
jgi:hypothetical protein